MFPDNWGDHCPEADNIDRARVHFAYLGYFFGVINTHRNFYVLNIVVFARKIMQDTSKFSLLILEIRHQSGNEILSNEKDHSRGDPGAIKLPLLILSKCMSLLTS